MPGVYQSINFIVKISNVYADMEQKMSEKIEQVVHFIGPSNRSSLLVLSEFKTICALLHKHLASCIVQINKPMISCKEMRAYK